jgi:drug/metabolite transporter (DMT)-like permease
MNLFFLLLAQSVYSLSDLGKKIVLQMVGFGWQLVSNIPFLAISAAAIFGFALQMFVLSRYELSKTTITLGVLAVLISALLGALVLHERLSGLNLLGIGFAIAAIVLLQLR